jgi:hypothetical protein
MRTLLLSSVALSMLVLGSACGEAKPATDPSSTTGAPVSAEAKEGESCGGGAAAPAKPRTCAAGLTCKNDAGDPTFPGKCVK